MALGRFPKDEVRNLIHHSDRCVQYASYKYTSILKDYKMRISMTECGNPRDNAVAERVNNTIKNELLKGATFFNLEAAHESVKAALEFYNLERPQLSLDGMTPSEVSKCTGEIKKDGIAIGKCT